MIFILERGYRVIGRVFVFLLVRGGFDYYVDI